jgi:hypothetical protein
MDITNCIWWIIWVWDDLWNDGDHEGRKWMNTNLLGDWYEYDCGQSDYDYEENKVQYCHDILKNPWI